MIDELRDRTIHAKVGGAFKLTTLIQKRLVELNRGSKPLVERLPGESNLEIVIKEIMQDKIYLSMKNELRTIEDDYMRDSIDFDSL